ncbi:MAG: hypothetical protein KKD05_06075 [Candidatus Omnitrophica bacterium]|nr:hypothetical protein [Candidatus Omnitrophota bacterium]
MKGFTLVELMVSILIMTGMVIALFAAFEVGRNVYDSNQGLMEKQRIIQQTMGAMVKEIRQAKLSDITLSNGNTRIDFIIPTGVNPLTNSSNIRYSISNNQIVREHPPGNQQVLAINVDSLIFDLSGNLLEIEIQARISLRTGDMVFTVKEKVSLRS